MIDQRVLYCAILILVAVFNLITAACTLLQKNTDAIKRRWMFWMQLLAATMLVGDAAAWYFSRTFRRTGILGDPSGELYRFYIGGCVTDSV